MRKYKKNHSSLIPKLSDESVAQWELQQLKEKVHPLFDILETHSIQDAKVVHRLFGSELTIECQLLLWYARRVY